MTENVETRVYIFGDSICFGQYVSPHLVWPSRLSAALEAEFAPLGQRILIQNPSINGNTTRQGLERVAFDVQSHKPHFLYIQFGMNDCHYWDTDLGLPRVSPEAFMCNLVELVKRGFQNGAQTVFLPTNHPTTRTQIKLVKGAGPTYEDSNRRYADLLREAAAKAGAVLIDTRRAFEKRMAAGATLSDFVLPDGLHLSPLGHEVYFHEIHPVIRQKIASRAKP